MLKHKGYTGCALFDGDEGIFHGEVLGTRDVITFQGTTVKELRKSFQDSVEDYLAFCKSCGEVPDKPFSGKFVLRVDPELHHKLHVRAAEQGKSLNAWLVKLLERSV